MQVEPQRYHAFRIDRQNLNAELNHEEGHTSPIEELAQIPQSQLEEDVGITFCRQFKAVAHKFLIVLFPVQAEEKVNYLRNWDLWGPFLMAVAFLLIIGTDDKFMAIVQALIFGAGLVNFNIRALGGSISYFQSLSILGYSMFPLLFATVMLKILALFKFKYMPIIMVVEFAATFWAILQAARAFTVINIHTTRRFVAVVPIAIIYFYIASHFIFYSFYGEAWTEGGEAAAGDDDDD